MGSLDSYVTKARKKGVSDKHIQQTLKDEGWKDSAISQALSDLKAPKPPTNVGDSSSSPSTSPLQSALHHVLLWFFLVSSSISISFVIASLFGTSVSTEALASLIAVTLVTFTPYAFFFILFQRQLGRNPKTVPSRIWSIITICLASVGAMAAAITLVVSLVTGAHVSLIVGSTLTFALFALTLTVYGFATFAPPNVAKARRFVLMLALPAFAVLIGTLFVMSLLQLGPAKHDEALRIALVKTTQVIKNEVAKTGTLPSAADARLLVTDSTISYTLKSSSTYELCTTFQTTSNNEPDYSNYVVEDLNTKPMSDSYLGDYNFTASTGLQCFEIQSDQLALPEKDNP